jgi:23S rRNA pseudouridine2605 synthase
MTSRIVGRARMPGRTTRVALNRALSKLGVLSRTDATDAIRHGRVRVDGRLVRDPLVQVDPARVTIDVDGARARTSAWRAILFYKPAGVLTTRRDPQGRRTIFDVLGPDGDGLEAVGRLDLASSGLLILTNDTQLANWITDPINAVPRVYLVTVRGRMTREKARQLTEGIADEGEILAAHAVTLRKISTRESHLTIELRTGKNREVRRLLKAVGHEVTRLQRVALGGLDLHGLQPGEWIALTRADIHEAFPLRTARQRTRS